jgi:hypothetical protein
MRCANQLVKRHAISSIHNLHLPPWLKIFSPDIVAISQSITGQQMNTQGVEALNGWFFTAEARVRSHESPCGFLVHRVALRHTLLLTLPFHPANYCFTSVPYPLLTLSINDGDCEDTISSDHRRIKCVHVKKTTNGQNRHGAEFWDTLCITEPHSPRFTLHGSST